MPEPLKDYWSEGGQIFFTGGKGWGLTDDLRTVPLGNEADILETFKTGKLADYLKPIQRVVLLGILDYRKELEHGADSTFRPVKARGKRSRPISDIEHRVVRAKRSPLGKRLPGSKV